VIPGRREAASPESIATSVQGGAPLSSVLSETLPTARGYGFRLSLRSAGMTGMSVSHELISSRNAHLRELRLERIERLERVAGRHLVGRERGERLDERRLRGVARRRR